MQKRYLTGEKNCCMFYMKTMLTSVAFRKHPCKMVNLFKIRRHQVFRSDRKERKKGGVMTLVRNNINVSETKQYMEEAEYLELKVTIRESSLNIVNCYCSNDKKLSLDTIQISDSNSLMVGYFNSQSQSLGYNTLDQR